MNHALRPEPLPNWDSYCYYPQHVPSLLCERIIACAQRYPEQAGQVVVSEQAQARPGRRDCRLRWMRPDAESAFIYEALGRIMHMANTARWGFDLHGFADALQYTEYREAGHHHDWHMDLGPGPYSTRKLSLVLQLSDGADYGGADFEVLSDCPSNAQRAAMRELGSVIVFPSYTSHRVSPLQQGCRHSLVAWMVGTAFR